ncbi:MAG: PAS domain S-box protein [Cohaesibacter sp.]|nr:PAS domain S-box protein [Cohaesibacter sp.]
MQKEQITLRLSLLLGIGLLVGFALIYFAYDFGRKERLATLLQSARSYSSMMTAFRHFYSQEIVARLKEQDAPITFSHAFKHTPNSLPLPATLTIELSKFLTAQQDHPVFEMVSRYPFSNRAPKSLSPFKERALSAIEQGQNLGESSDYFESRALDNGQHRLDYAQKIVMKSDCVACHNSHPHSTRRDWKIGDVRGIQTVSILSEQDIIPVLKRMMPLLFVYLLILAASLGLASLFFARNRRAIERLQDTLHETQIQSIELQKATERLLQVEGYLSDAIASLPDGFVLYDKKDRLVLCNDKYREIYAASADLIKPGAKFKDIIRKGVERGQYPEALDDPNGWIEQRMQEHYHPRGPIEQRLNDGRWLRVFEQKTEKGQIVGFRIDITELKQREQALAERESQLRATMESALDGIVVIDDQGVICEFNDAASKIFGFEPQESIGQPMAELIIPAHLRDAHHKGMDLYRKTGHGPVLGQRITVPGLCKDGREITLELAINPAQSSAGELFIAYMRDITDALAQQTALEEAKAAAEEAAKAKAVFLAIMSHEIRTPLNGLLGLLEMLESEISDPQMHRKSVTALDSAVALSDLLNSILDYSRLEAGKVALKERAFELRPFIKKTMDLVRPSLEKKGLEACIEIDPVVPPFVFYDDMRLRQILLNLLGNAIKFTKEGHVALRIGPCLTPDTLCFHVEDSGIGIKAQDIGHIFEHFNMLDPSHHRESDGSGLGLSITKSLADLMDGTLKVASEQGKGSLFTLELPLELPPELPLTDAKKPSASLQRPDEAALDQRFEGLSVLLAEDNETNRQVLGASLKQFGMMVTEVANGLHAVEQARRHKEYDLIILDISMPIMDGIEAVGHIRQIKDYQHCPILAFTAYGQEEERVEFLQAGFDAILSKPTRKRHLFQMLCSLLDQPQRAETQASPQKDQIVLDMLDQGVLSPMFDDIPLELAHKLATTCLNDLTDNMNKLKSGWQAKDWEQMHRASHILKGLTDTFGMRKLSIPTCKIANLTRAKPDHEQQQSLISAMDQIEKHFAPTHAALRQVFEALDLELGEWIETEKKEED